MKKIVASVLLASMLLMGMQSVFGQDVGQIRIAILDMGTALLNSDVARSVEEELQQETFEDQENIKRLAEQAQQLQRQLQQDADVMSESEQQRIVGEVQELQNQYQYLVQKIQTLSQERMQQFQQTYSPNLVQAIREVVEEEGLNLVIRADAAVYQDNVIDITAKVTEKLNQQ